MAKLWCCEFLNFCWPGILFCFICRISLELQKEADVAKLDHRNIVALFATVCETDHYGIVMEFVLNGALDDYILDNSVCCLVSDLYKPVLYFV